MIEEARYLTLATSDGEAPWAAPVEYLRDDDGTFYFFSPADTRHIARNATVSAAIFAGDQPEYTPDVTTTLRDVQLRASEHQLSGDEYPPAVEAAIDALEPPMPPYEAFAIEPERVYAPVIEDGVNKRVEVDLTGSA